MYLYALIFMEDKKALTKIKMSTKTIISYEQNLFVKKLKL